MEHIINLNTKINSQEQAEIQTEPVRRGIERLYRDLRAVCEETDREGAGIYLNREAMPEEGYRIEQGEKGLMIYAGDDIGFVYALLEVSRVLLGVKNFWFWNDQKFIKRAAYPVPENFAVVSKPARVKYRGWFVNDEVLLQTWSIGRRKDTPWEMVFEALLRCGGNMVIPGTDKNSKSYRRLASGMGLMITHHHAEPLGAEMFARAYPEMAPSYDKYPELFRGLWEQGIEEQKDSKVLWNLGFRGQGDCPFWENDPQYQTPQSRGKLMGDLIRLQYDIVKEKVQNPVCCTNLYGETMKLYREGFLKLPENIIRIWADNGYGKMVSRRQGNDNPRVYSLPGQEDGGSHGIYYHVSFYDLQAANHITMLPNSPEFVKKELTEALNRHADTYWIINCSNVKPHVYYLDLIAKMWGDGDVDVEGHREEYLTAYYGRVCLTEITECFRLYSGYAPSYGKQEDEHAGEQFSNHVTRMLISQYMKNQAEPAGDLRWAVDAGTLKEQILWYQKLCKSACAGYKEYLYRCEQTALRLPAEAEKLFRDSLLLQVQIHFFCYKGALLACEGLNSGLEGNLIQAFYKAGLARESYLQANQCMRDREHGKWHGFYENECLSDVKQTAWLLEGLMYLFRNEGDGPHFYAWQREFLYAREDSQVLLLLNQENHLNNQEIFKLMKERWEDEG